MAWLDGLDPQGHAIVPPAAEGDTAVTGYSVLGVAHARGEQHYIAEYSEADQAWAWVLEGPTAVLTDAYTGEMVAHHGGGRDVGGPTWTAMIDNSVAHGSTPPGFVADKLADRIAPLKVYTSGSGGVMKRVEVVQRLETSGGHPGPAPEPYTEAGHRKAVPYSATYVFWGALPEPEELQPDPGTAYA